MKCIKCLGAVILLTITFSAFSQTPASIQSELKKHITILAHDSMEGRLVGSPAEARASQYITREWTTIGIEPKGKSNYLQAFTFTRLAYSHRNSRYFFLKKGGHTVSFSQVKDIWNDNLYPVSVSGAGSVRSSSVWLGYGIHHPGSQLNDYKGKSPKDLKGKVFVMWYGSPQTESNPHSSLGMTATMEAKVDTAIQYGAAAVIFLQPVDSTVMVPEFKKYTQGNKIKSIPVFFSRSQNNTLYDNAQIELEVDTQRVTITGNNVIGYINNNAENTIVIGAHYDHLGYNEFGSSTYRPEKNEKPQIHNGADDNASGTAALIVLSGELKKAAYAKHNYLFIAFSGEEEGLLGSNYFTKNPTIDLAKVNAMINMDMVGRLDPEKYSLGINGTGTSKEWETLLGKITIDSLKFKYTKAGTGASDHTSFYYSNIPVLHYFTGNHYDYHKPSDDEYKINYGGAEKVVTHITRLIDLLNQSPRLTFTATKEDTATKVSFKVTLGIMPDYMFEGKGVKVDGVTQGRPAAVAGVLKEDIILRIGTYPTESMPQYMQVLGKFNKGDATTILIQRKGETKELPIRF